MIVIIGTESGSITNTSMDLYDTSHRMRTMSAFVQLTTNLNDKYSYFPRRNGQKNCTLLHLNTLYDLNKYIYVDIFIQKRHTWNEHKTFVSMINRFEIPKALIIADGEYKSYNNILHIQVKASHFLFTLNMSK